MIEFVTGDLFSYEANVRVNTVNCVGVMGAGVALAFKNKYPNMFNDYKDRCKRGIVIPGVPYEYQINENLSIINFPTKNHWKYQSEYTWINTGLDWLSQYLSSRTDKIITLPALGCGHGGLDWNIVKDMIIYYLSNSNNKILVFNPNSSRIYHK
jgi:O-acetyl-ADP-ribose deacetylase (regulator of RNase III)